MDQARKLIAKAKALPPPPASNFFLHHAIRTKSIENPTLRGSMNLMMAGRILAIGGDQAGLDACDTAFDQTSRPLTQIEASFRSYYLGLRDEAYVSMLVTNAADRARYQKWLTEENPFTVPAVFRGERLIHVGLATQAWLGLIDAENLKTENSSSDLRSLLLSPRMHRAWTAGNLAESMRIYHELENGSPLKLTPTSFRSSVGRMLFPVQLLFSGWSVDAGFRHAFLRLGARIWMLGATDLLPTDQATLVQALGQPLSVPKGAINVPLVYERRRGRGFRLSVPESQWALRSHVKPRSPGTRVSFPGNPPELIIDLDAKPVPVIPSKD